MNLEIVFSSLESMAVLEKIFRVHDQLLPGAPGAKAIETQLRVHRVHKTGCRVECITPGAVVLMNSFDSYFQMLLFQD